MLSAIIPNSPAIVLKGKCHGKSEEARLPVLGVLLRAHGSWVAREEEGSR